MKNAILVNFDEMNRIIDSGDEGAFALYKKLILDVEGDYDRPIFTEGPYLRRLALYLRMTASQLEAAFSALQDLGVLAVIYKDPFSDVLGLGFTAERPTPEMIAELDFLNAPVEGRC